ncbi:carbohydrate porin [Roseococcus sp. SDR]|uniref:carbohydrate porin n=1 Tax=Roseococcus sp. SDR TaxID=2835532 RepID=UPI001BCC6308|nr:carbohydrate porin [Roseococcus sp. SDR]MBS7789356.1 carbohydrate porin [Roseococcus sp. SDR]MBV1844670.1 carbohydrate porin [Roseococcus sp. SDR]
MQRKNIHHVHASLHLKTYAYLVFLLGVLGVGKASAQSSDAIFPRLAETQAQLEAEGWLLRGQSTFVQNFYPTFRAPYEGGNSLNQGPRGRNTFSADVVLGRRLWTGAEVVFNPIVTRGHGLSGTRGFAAFPNGEAFRVGTDGPMATVARLFLRQTIGLSSDMAAPDDDPLRFRAPPPRERITLTVGKFSIFDIFDDNRYAHDPRTQFLNWAFVGAGAFDFANDAKGYTLGAAAEWENGHWGLRAGAFQVARRVNSLSMDPQPLRGHQFLVQGDRFFEVNGRPGAVRLVAGLSRSRAQTYNALLSGDIEATDESPTGRYTTKHMLILNMEQEVTDDLGLFARLSWNDGRTQQWMFTQMDWAISAGASLAGTRWARPQDRVGLAANIGGLASGQRRFLAAGGLGFIIGDGRLNYRPETTTELYYDMRAAPGSNITANIQLIANPGHNADRGPVVVMGLRLRTAF